MLRLCTKLNPTPYCTALVLAAMHVLNLCKKLNPTPYCTALVLVGVRFLQFFLAPVLSAAAMGVVGAGGAGGGGGTSAAVGGTVGMGLVDLDLRSRPILALW